MTADVPAAPLPFELQPPSRGITRKSRLNLKAQFSGGKAQANLIDELQLARDRGEARVCTVDFANAIAKLDEGRALESTWADAVVRFGSRSRGIFGLQLGLSRVDDDVSSFTSEVAWRLVARIKPKCLTLAGGTYGDSDGHWAARAVFQIGRPGALCAVIPDHRPALDLESGKRPSVREVCIGQLLVDDEVLTEVRSTGALQLCLHVAVRDAGGPVEKEVQYGCGCC